MKGLVLCMLFLTTTNSQELIAQLSETTEFILFDQLETFDSARLICENHDATLARVANRAEYDFILNTSLFSQLNGEELLGLWIGRNYSFTTV